MSIPALNPLVLSLKESATLAINQKTIELRKNGVNVYHFGFGQSPFPVPEIIQEGLRRNTDKKDYLPTQGLPELCEVISKFYKSEFNYNFLSKNICIGPGSKELIFQTIYLIEGPLLVPAPSWVSYGPQAALRGKEIIPIITKRDNGYRLQVDELDRAAHKIGQSQKLLIINNPNNPTGSVYREHELKEIAEICRAYEIIVISDEIYSMIEFIDKPFCSLAHYYPEGTIVTGGISKSFAAGGYRLGCMMIPDELSLVLKSLKSVVSETFSSVSAPIQFSALSAYGNFESIRPFIKKTCEIYKYVSTYIYERFVEMGLNCPIPEGSFYLFPDFENYRSQLNNKLIITGRSLCDTLLDEARIALLPGSDFYLPATNLGVRVAAVDFDGKSILDQWPGSENMNKDKTYKFFPNIVNGCNKLDEFLKHL